MDMIAVSTYCIKIEPISFTNFRADRFNIINTIIISEQFPSIFYAEYHVISNFIGTMTCLSNLNHLSEDMQSSLSRFLDHPSRSKLRGIHLKIKGDIDFSNVCFLEPVTFWNSSIVGYADFSGAQFDLFGIISSKFNQSVDFSYSQFKEDAYFPYSEFNQSVDYRRSQFNKSVFFNESKFDKQIDFSMSRFNQSIDFSFFILMHQSTLEGLILPNQLTSVTLNSTNLLTSGLILTSQQTLIMFNSREMPILADLNSINQPPLMMLNLTRMSTSVLLNSPEMLISVLLNSTSGPSSIFLILAGMLIFMVPYSMSTLISGNLDSKSPQTL